MFWERSRIVCLGEVSRLNVVNRQVFVLEECDNIFLVALILNDLPKAPGHLEVTGSALVHEDRVHHVQPPRAGCGIVGLLVDEHNEVVAKSGNLLARRLERTGRLRLPDAGDLNVNIQAREVDAACRVPSPECVTFNKIRSKLVLKIRSYSLAVSYPEQGRLIVFTLNLCERRSFFQ